MPQCPNCHAENSSESRFCAECGTRLSQPPAALQDQPTAPASASGDPPRPTGKETVVLRALDLPPTERLPGQLAGALPPPTDKTILAGHATSPATGATIIAGPPGAPTPPNATSTPTSALPAPPSGGQMYTPPTSSPAAPSASKSGGGRLWLVIALVVLLGLGMVGALVGGVLLVTRNTGTADRDPTPQAGGGLARLPSAEPRPTARVRPTATARPTAAPRPTAVAEPTAASGDFSQVLLEDGFDNSAGSRLTEDTTDNATYAFVDGGYAIHVKTPRYVVWSPFDGDYDDASVEVDTTLDKGPSESAVGIIFRYQDENNFYFFSISGTGSYSLDLYKADDRQTLIDWTVSPAIQGPGQTNRLRVETVDDRIRLFVNDTLLDEISDDSFSTGEMALAVNTFSKGDATFTFDNLVVRGRR